MVDGWQSAPQQEAHAVSQPIYGVHLGKTRRSLMRQGDGRQTPPGILRAAPHPPWMPQSHQQNTVVIDALSEAAARYARGGFPVIVDALVGPWFLEPFSMAAAHH